MYPNTKFIIGSLPKGGWRINPILFASKQVIPKRTYKNKLILIRNHAGDMYSCQPTYQKKYIHIGQRSEWQMTESAVALGVVGIDRLGGGVWGGGAVPNFRFAGPFWPKNGPLWAARKRRKHRKYQQKWP